MHITVQGISGYSYRVTMGEHDVIVDQPREEGGDDRGPTPTDLFIAGLASCAAYYAGKFLARRGIPPEAVSARCDYRISSERPARVESINLTLDLPPGISDQVRAAALRSAQNCTVHNSLSRPPEVTISLDAAIAAA